MNTQPTTRVSFDFKMSDMSEPSRILCRVDAIVGSVNGYTSFDPAYDTEVEDPNVSIFLYEILSVFFLKNNFLYYSLQIYRSQICRSEM